MAFVPTAEDKARYRANRTRKYHEDHEYRATVRAKNTADRNKNRDQINATRRHRLKTDAEYRERTLAAKRAICPQRQRNGQLKVNYGITLDDFNQMAAAQGFVCAVCSQPPEDTLCVDHCHSTSKVRGLLCRKCNTGLGCFKDTPELMIKAIAYLEANRGD